jgi:hypothetical protein
LANHRRAYLEYEGEISGNRGRVSRIEEGTYQISHLPDGAKLIQWNCPSVPPLILKKEDQSRWSARPTC